MKVRIEIQTENQYQEALKKRSNLLEAYSHLSCANEDSLDCQISEIDAQIERYESKILSNKFDVKKYIKQRMDFYKKHLIDLICGFILLILVFNGTLTTLEYVVNGYSIPNGIWLWLKEPVTIIAVLCMFGFNLTNIRRKKNA